MSPTEIDKVAGRRRGYFPDYSVWISGLPLLVIEAKGPDVEVHVGLREARLYAGEINRRYPPDVNPIHFVLASNGHDLAVCQWDSEASILLFKTSDLRPGSNYLQTLIDHVGKSALDERFKQLSSHFSSRRFHRISSFMGGQSRVNRLLGFNEFAEPLFPALTKYFGDTSETPDDVIERAYVTSDELTTYEGVLETYLKDRTDKIAGSQVKPIETSRNNASSLTAEVQKFAGSPKYFSRVQIIVGAVGSGKSTFIRRYYKHLLNSEIRQKTAWAFIDFNDTGPDLHNINAFVSEKFLASFEQINKLDIYDESQLEKIFAPSLNRFERSNKSLQNLDSREFLLRKLALRDTLAGDHEKFAEAVARHFSGERGLGLVVVFDNVDKRSRDQQLAIFESAQWFKSLSRGLILFNLRDTTFEAHKDEPPLDAFINAINFYIKPPRFAQVIRKRLELLLENLPNEVAPQQEYALASGYRIKYPASRLGNFLISIYLSLFESKETRIAASLEALVAKDVRRALGMFGEILVSPHLPTSQITGAALAGRAFRIPERHILRSLMRARYQVYNGKSPYIHNILRCDENHLRPSNFLYCDILEYLIRNRKNKIDFNQEGYATVSTIIKQMGRIGYDESDAFSATNSLAEKGLIEPEGLVYTDLTEEDGIRVHASGFVHSKILLFRDEYILGISSDLVVSSKETAEQIGSIWASYDASYEMSLSNKISITEKIKDYFKFEYQRRCRRHAFYEEYGFGGKLVIDAADHVFSNLSSKRSAR